MGKYVRKPPSKKVNKECFGGLKESKYFNWNKKLSRKAFISSERNWSSFNLVFRNDESPLPISSLALAKFTKFKTQPYYQESKAEDSFKTLFNITELHYEDALQLVKSSLNSWKTICLVFTNAKFLKVRKYPLALTSNMNETPVFFNLVPNKSFAKKGSRSITVKTSAVRKNMWQLL